MKQTTKNLNNFKSWNIWNICLSRLSFFLSLVCVTQCGILLMYRVARENLNTFKISVILAVIRVIRRWNGNFVDFFGIFSKMVKNVPMKRFLHFSGKWQNRPTRIWNLTLKFNLKIHIYQKLFDYTWSIYHSDEKISKIRNSYIVRPGKTGSGIPDSGEKNLTIFFLIYLQTFLVICP